MKLIVVPIVIFGLICMAMASEMDYEPEQLADMMQHRLETRSGRVLL